MKRHLPRILFGLVLLLVLLSHIIAFPIGLVKRFDNIIYDGWLKSTMPRTVDNRIVILDIDEKSLAEIGRWPWSRHVMAKLVDKLFNQHQIQVLGFDVVFAEPDGSSGLKILEDLGKGELKNNFDFQKTLNQLRPTLDYDQTFAKTIKGKPITLGFYFNQSNRVSGLLPSPVFPAGAFKGKSIGFESWNGYGANLPEFQSNAQNAGHFNTTVDTDGIVRRVPILVEYQGAYYEALSLAVIRSLFSFPGVIPGYPEESVFSKNRSEMEWLELRTNQGTIKIPVDEKASALIPYRGGQGSFNYFSIADVLTDRVKPEELKGKIVLVGTTAPGLFDLRSTPVHEAYAGVEIHANLIAGMLDGNIKHKPGYMVGAEVLLLLFAGIVMVGVVPFLNAPKATAVTLGILFVVAGASYFLWSKGNLVLPIATSLLFILGAFTLNMAWGYFVESRSKRELAKKFGQYIVPELVDQMSKDPQRYGVEGQNKDLTVLFADVRNFTTISEKLEPKKVAQLMNEYLTPMSRVIRNDYLGTLDKYIGDEIMAFWGAPVDQQDHPRRAVKAALHMQSKLRALRDYFKQVYDTDIHIGIGLSTGIMTVGDMGSEVRWAYTVIGDAVNLGARLQGLTKYYGVEILVPEATRKAVQEILFREVDRVRVKGKGEPVTIYEPLGEEKELEKNIVDELKLWGQALRFYRSQDWDRAELQILNLRNKSPNCELYQRYLEKIAYYRANPPGAEWDGVTNFSTK